ncbi:MAG TPA: Maf family protein [Solirubrobacteraceae bacterium]|nr:Maf family protein [Solirubrobacteraceae bacterium]
MPPARLILASASPQRRAILEQIGIPFEVRVSGAEELEEGPAAEVALENAYRKATAVARAADGPPLPVLGVDTVVSLGVRNLGKPCDSDEAREMLSALAGRGHVVVSGLCLIEGGRVRTSASQTVVEFRALEAAAINSYVETGEWRGRAGAYAIQGRGAILVSRVEGDYLGVVGLPVATLLDLAPGLIAD